MSENNNISPANNETQGLKLLECSTLGDKRFCPSHAIVAINGVEKSIDDWYHEARRDSSGSVAERGMPFDHIVDPFTGDKLRVKDGLDLYRGLWITYFNNHPELVEYASGFDEFTNQFSAPGLENCHEEIIGAYIKGNRDWYAACVRASHWYKNMAEKNKASLREKIRKAQSASIRCGSQKDSNKLQR